jgi:hypothetical protein
MKDQLGAYEKCPGLLLSSWPGKFINERGEVAFVAAPLNGTSVRSTNGGRGSGLSVGPTPGNAILCGIPYCEVRAG